MFGANLFSALGAGAGLQQAGKSGEIRVVAADAPGSIVDNIKTGLADVAIAQHPAEIGYYGVISAYAHLSGNSIPTSIGTGFTVIDKANVDDPEVARYIYSEEGGPAPFGVAGGSVSQSSTQVSREPPGAASVTGIDA